MPVKELAPSSVPPDQRIHPLALRNNNGIGITMWFLQTDVERALEHLAGEGSDDPNRRAFVRAAMGYIDGVGHAMRQVGSSFHHWVTPIFDARELAAMEGRDPDNPTRRKRVSTAEHVKLALYAFATIEGTSYQPQYATDPGWKAMRRAVAIRNRVTHPDSPVTYRITDEELGSVETALAWFKREFLSCVGDGTTMPGYHFQPRR
jgi:hypothetical protein